LKKIQGPNVQDLRLVPFDVPAAHATGGGTPHGRLALGDEVVDHGTYARQWYSTFSSSSSRSLQSQDDQTVRTLQCHEEWMQYIISMIQVKYLQVLCKFSSFIKILLNHVLNDFLQHGYTPYDAPQPPSFPHPTTLGDPSTPHIDSSQVNETTIFIQARISIIKHA
jgi:hypothetical protein